MKQIKVFSNNTKEDLEIKVNEFIQKLESSNREVIDIKFSTYKDLYFNVLIIHDDEKSNGILEVWR